MKIVQIITDYIRRSILTTQGDMVVRGASLPERLVAVALGQVLKSGGVGALPAWGKPALSEIGIFIGGGTRSTAGNEAVTGVGFTPSLVLFMAHDVTNDNSNLGVGFDDGATARFMCLRDNGASQEGGSGLSMRVRRDVGNKISGVIASMDADGFTITWSLTGAVNAYYRFLAIG